MTREEAVKIIRMNEQEKWRSGISAEDEREAVKMAIEALSDNKPSRTWIAKNEYRRGWHDAITRALSEVMKIHVGNEIFDMVQKETLIGLGLSMDSALGAEPYSETEESYPKPDRPHGEWIKEPIYLCHYGCDGCYKDKKYANLEWCSTCEFWKADDFRYVCSNCNNKEEYQPNFCPNCGLPMNEKALEILRKRKEE